MAYPDKILPTQTSDENSWEMKTAWQMRFKPEPESLTNSTYGHPSHLEILSSG